MPRSIGKGRTPDANRKKLSVDRITPRGKRNSEKYKKNKKRINVSGGKWRREENVGTCNFYPNIPFWKKKMRHATG